MAMQNARNNEPRDAHKKWDGWSYQEKPKTIPLVNYTSAIVFGLATFVEMTGGLI